MVIQFCWPSKQQEPEQSLTDYWWQLNVIGVFMVLCSGGPVAFPWLFDIGFQSHMWPRSTKWVISRDFKFCVRALRSQKWWCYPFFVLFRNAMFNILFNNVYKSTYKMNDINAILVQFRKSPTVYNLQNQNFDCRFLSSWNVTPTAFKEA